MANRFLVATGNWNSNDTWSDTDGGAPGASFPVAGDNAYPTAASGAVTLTVNVSSACADFDCDGFTGTWAGSSALNIGGSFRLGAAMTRTYTGTLTYNATSTGKTITCNSVVLASPVVFNGVGGGWTCADAFNTGANLLTLTNGALDTNGKTVTISQMSSNNSNSRSLTLGASTLNVSGTGNSWIATATLTLNAGTSTINLTGSTANFNGGGLTYNVLSMPSLDINEINGANTFATLTLAWVTGAAWSLTLNANNVVTGTFTATGFSASSRPLIKSSVVGTARTITAAAVSLTDVDFTDITGAGAAAPFTGTRLGNAAGNSGITFTTPADKFYVGNTANWNGTVWALTSGGAAGANNFPLPQDTAKLDANSFSANGQTLTINGAFRLPSIVASGTDQTYIVACTSSPTFYGDITLDANAANSGVGSFTFVGRTTQTVTSAGKAFTSEIELNSIGGTLVLSDAYSQTTAGTAFTLTKGTFDLNGQTATVPLFNSNNSNIRTLKSSQNGGKIATTSTSTGTPFMIATTTNLTVDRDSGTWTIEVGGNTTNVRTMNLGVGKTWPAITFTNTTASGGLDIVSSGTATVIKSLAVSTPPQTIRRTAGTTITVEDDNGFPSGTLGNLVTIGSITASSHTWAKSGGGTISSDYLSISRSTATPGSTWYAGANSTDGLNNSGWLFSAPGSFTASSFRSLMGVGI